ncbi:hypothetical protein ACWGIB_09115 [Streptomyces xiamenensis]
MSNSEAAAILTTPDLTQALRAVRTLLDIAEIRDDGEADFEAMIRTPEVLAAVGQVVPDLEWWALAGQEHGSANAGDDPTRCLPIRVLNWSRPLELAEPFIAALGREPGVVRFDLDAWPAVPEAGLGIVSQKFAYLTLSVNSRDLYQDEPSGDHTVHVHVPPLGDNLPRVQWLADAVGGRFTGRVEMSLL